MAARRSLGFTLIEIIIVMALLAILSTALWSNFISAINKGKDSRRKQDLKTIAEALELYYNDEAYYPLELIWGGSLANPDDASLIYLQKIPNDPLSNRSYCYDRSDENTFIIYTNLENPNDSERLSIPVTCSADGLEYNYVLKSSNQE